MDVYIAGKRRRITDSMTIGSGGEADIYALGQGVALKLYKSAAHPDLAAFPSQQQEATRRLAMLQHKLPAFPRPLPVQVVAPQDLATDRQGRRILGYTMPRIEGAEVLWRYGDKSFRQAGVSAAQVSRIFGDLHRSVSLLHSQGIVIGDFNDLNVLVRDTQAFLIDADSFQFGPYLCQVYSERFVDPLLCDPTASRPVLMRPYTPDSDWYAFTVMLFRALLLVDPYGGVYKPAATAPPMPHSARPLHRLSVLDPLVKYPKPAYPYTILPEPLLQHFQDVFRRDQRGPFPLPLLEQALWVTCPHCRLEHARPACPTCGGTVPLARHAVLRVHGMVTDTRLVDAPGPLLAVTAVNGTLHFLTYTRTAFFRDGASVVFSGQLHPHMVFRLLPHGTLVGHGNQLLVVADHGPIERLAVDTCDGAPVFDSNDATYFWVHDGQLLRSTALGPEPVGTVLRGQTRLWVNSTLGFGLSRLGTLAMAFVFDPRHRGLNDSIHVPPMPGHLLQVTCKLAQDRCWLLWSSTEHGQLWRHAAVILANGTVVATLRAAADTVPWLDAVSGALAVGAGLLVPTDAGIVRVEVEQGQIALSKTFPDTEPFVDATSTLLAGPQGLYVVRNWQIHLLTMQSAP